MATKNMLIDASHPEETRVVVLDGTRLEGYDVEVASRRQLKGNIYLAKVTRVEPSLQAAFVDYGGNRHGFLAFNEIHPDYYQIPVADRLALMEEHGEAEASAADADADADIDADASATDGSDGDAEPVEILGGDDEEELERRPPRPVSRNYKIQEVIKRRQILLVQVVKEERGNKGAALTTYLSLAGRYCVLMPNTSRGGGISRKISSLTDRKRLKKVLTELEVPEGMGVIVRTAGSGRTKAEVKRDYEYLMRLWSNIRETTLSSIAPALVYEEANLIKRSIRDLYGRDTEEIVIQGEPEYRTAKEFMKLFIPSHAKRVKLHDDPERPLFHLFQVESQLDAMHLPSVPLRSGGYIVINPTEALVSIDVNSGRATRERHIEETALRTNLEAADEIARQLRLRDLAGLIVIDFIDMENSRNQGQVERRIKDALKSDRARIQVGRISPFGLLELSRQRLRPSLLETSFEPCPYCGGMGVCRTTESTVLSILRKIEDEGLKAKGGSVTVTAAPTVAMYLLNQKRKTLAQMEGRFQLRIVIAADGSFAPAEHRLERVKGAVVVVETAGAPLVQPAIEVSEPAVEEEEEVRAADAADAADAVAGDEAGKQRTRRRRPRRRRRSDEDTQPLAAPDEVGDGAGDGAGDRAADGAGKPVAADAAADEAEVDEPDGEGGGEGQGDLAAQGEARKRRRRGKRGGRRRPRRGEEAAGEAEAVPSAEAGEAEAIVVAATTEDQLEPAATEAEVDAEGEDRYEIVDANDSGDWREDRQEPAPAEAEAEAAIPDDGPLFAAAGSGDAEEPDEPAPVSAAEEGEPDGAAEADAESDSFEIVSYSRETAAWQPPGDGPEEAVADGDAERRAAEETAADPTEAVPAAAEAPMAVGGNGSGSGREVDDEEQPVVTEGAAAAEHEQAAARTEVIHVGGDAAQPGVPRRGWWQRLMS